MQNSESDINAQFLQAIIVLFIEKYVLNDILLVLLNVNNTKFTIYYTNYQG